MIRTLFHIFDSKKIKRWGERELIFNEGGEGIGGAKLLFRYVQFIPSSFPRRGSFSEMNQLRARDEEDRGGSALKNAPRGWWVSWEEQPRCSHYFRILRVSSANVVDRWMGALNLWVQFADFWSRRLFASKQKIRSTMRRTVWTSRQKIILSTRRSWYSILCVSPFGFVAAREDRSLGYYVAFLRHQKDCKQCSEVRELTVSNTQTLKALINYWLKA